MKKFYPHASIRCAGVCIVLLLVVLPGFLFFWPSELTVPGQELYPFLIGSVLIMVGCTLIHIGFWEKCFSHLELSLQEIRWKCPFRKDRVIPVEQCVEIGAYKENEGNGVPKDQIYFSDHPNPKKNMDKYGVIKASKHLIKFWYSEELCRYLIRTYPGKQTSCLLAYRQHCKP